LNKDENQRPENGASEWTTQLNEIHGDEICKYRFNVVGEDAAVLAEVTAEWTPLRICSISFTPEIKRRDPDISSGGNIPHHMFTIGRRLKQDKNRFEKFWMVMVRVISLEPNDGHKVFHLAEIVNRQINCGINWLFLIGTGTN
jgi:hypothetical protein